MMPSLSLCFSQTARTATGSNDCHVVASACHCSTPPAHNQPNALETLALPRSPHDTHSPTQPPIPRAQPLHPAFVSNTNQDEHTISSTHRHTRLTKIEKLALPCQAPPLCRNRNRVLLALPLKFLVQIFLHQSLSTHWRLRQESHPAPSSSPIAAGESASKSTPSLVIRRAMHLQQTADYHK
jgi:hypothetical protein